MSFDHIKEMLETLCYYKDVDIIHTFNKDEEPLLKVSCVKNTKTLQLAFIQNQTIEYYEDVEEAAFIIGEIIDQ
ncbi:hypothetical protein RRU94_17765 [Domibacillus sp. DTU_2020_1001157_1_SI_ALB_TIR_016]|uniref:hypothetical protein n=1 Tax=Domibacillus sp. DTU_2020_1001157_1_SI_ALB_TIR_016 TaxID=3077789 RepID=UPI0028E4EE1D|nr:hypothetical protein [Domibacillus sp. DTU_2020_1001157_1_SI_ALB_TIR_016]WNS79385.1 hypothetical protein RRU94_17765 [Domibacillus sp. DTU_2020_1001157_1_SI_ALB_TIR_016]